MVLVAAFLLGFVAGQRSMLSPAVAAWAIWHRNISVAGTLVAFMGHPYTRWILSALAVGELIADTLPFIPSRKSTPAFLARIVTGTASGAVAGVAAGNLAAGAGLGLLGAVAGTLGGAYLRFRLATAFASDFPAAMTEDLLAFALAYVAFRQIQ